MVILFLVTLFFLKFKNNVSKYIFINLISIIALLFHEGFAIFFVPTIFALLLFMEKKKYYAFTYYLLPIFSIWLIIITNGKADISIEKFNEILLSSAITNLGKDFSIDTIETIYYMTISEKIRFTLNFYSPLKLIKLFITLIVLSPALLCLGNYYLKIFLGYKDRKNKATIIILYLLTLSPLLALLFGIDTYRWIGWALFNNAIVIAILFYFNHHCRQIIHDETFKKRYFIAISIIITLLSGVFSVFYTYPFVERYMKIFIDSF